MLRLRTGTRTVTLWSVCLMLAACATTPPPTDLMNHVEGAIDQAEQRGADEHAPLELKFARRKFAAARAAVNREDHDEARRLAQEALANAELADAKTSAAQARAAAAEARNAVEDLRQELLGPEDADDGGK